MCVTPVCCCVLAAAQSVASHPQLILLRCFVFVAQDSVNKTHIIHMKF